MNRITLLVILLIAHVFLSAQGTEVRNLQCVSATNPLGIDARRPTLSWQITSDTRNIVQTAYRVIVSDNLTSIKNNIGNVWDSKKVSSGQSLQVAYDGKPLLPAQTYYWKVMVWDNTKKVSKWSPHALWQMGLLSQSDWKGAGWIAYDKMHDSLRLTPATSEWKRSPIKDILPLLRKDFTIDKPLKKASIFIAGLGHFELNVNGKKVGDHFLDPGWTNYDKHALYITFDVTSQLKQGGNALGVMLGNGFYFIPGERYLKLQLAYGYPKMICRLLLEYADGSSENIISDPSWKTAPGPTTFSSIYGGEDYNAGIEQPGWDTHDFKHEGWKNAIMVDGPPVLDAQMAPPLKIFEHFTPTKITQPKPGVWVYDLGQNASGIPQISLKGKKGSIVRLWPAELLDKNGLITTKPIGAPVYFDYTLKGGEMETWQPRFMYYGFRYVQVEGAIPAGEANDSGLPVVTALNGLHTRNAAERVGEFTCSNDMFNKIDVLIDWAIQSNMASTLTDCPHREKLGWLEEAHLVGPSMRYNYDIANLCRKVVKDMMHAQTPEGLVPDIAPEYAVFGGPFRDSPEWGSNSIIMPWYVYEWYGDRQLLEEAYPMMERYINYLQAKAKSNILSHGLGDWYDIGPKEPGPSQLTPHGITATAMYYYDLTIMAKIATILGRPQDAMVYHDAAAAVKKAYNAAFFNAQTKQYGSGSQTSNAMSVYMGLVEPQYKDSVVANMAREIKSRNNSLTAGDIGYRYLLRVLSDNGRSDVIYDMNSNAGVPGYGYQLARGATALTESWQAYDNASNNHMMLGHIKEWFYGGLAGIKASKNTVAFKDIEIRPQPVGDITSARATYMSPYGLIASDWKITNASFELTTEIPPNTTATVCLPAKLGSAITEKGKEIAPNRISFKDGYALIKVGSGKYNFKVK